MAKKTEEEQTPKTTYFKLESINMSRSFFIDKEKNSTSKFTPKKAASRIQRQIKMPRPKQQCDTPTSPSAKSPTRIP